MPGRCNDYQHPGAHWPRALPARAGPGGVTITNIPVRIGRGPCPPCPPYPPMEKLPRWSWAVILTVTLPAAGT